MKTIEEIRLRASELTNLTNILALLQWDQEVMMPTGGAAGRAAQFSALSTIVHRKICDPDLGKLLHELAGGLDEVSDGDQALVRVLKREYDKNTKLPEKFVADFARLTSETLPVWVKARKHNDFNQFLPLLEKVIAMCRQKAGFLDYVHHPYDALLDLYEEGLTTNDLDALF